MKKLKFNTLISIVMISYVVLLAATFLNEWEDMKMGFIQGYSAASLEKENKKGDDVYYLTVKPKESVLSFPEKLQNIKLNQEVKFRHHKMKVVLPAGKFLSKKDKIFGVITVFLSFIVFVVYLYIPFQFYGIMKNMQKELFFDLSNKKRFNNIGIALSFAFWSIFLGNHLFFQIKNSLFEFEDYVIIRDQTNFIWMLLSLVCLIVAEMISRGIKMKKEQEFTI
ncbi:MAG: DUF2975 domain-containing protein [Prolixibacteraceae bacterium]